MRYLCAVLMVAGLVGVAAGQTRITQAELLRRVINLDRLTTPPPAGERTRMFSSYDRRSRIDEHGQYVDWDANNDWGQFMRRDADGWDVMAELDGPGAITRLWTANPQGQIRFVLDGEVVIDTTFEQLMSGKLPPFEEPLVYRGLDCYFPIGFNQSCRVLCRDSHAYYQINTVQFPRGTSVDRFTFDLNDAARAALEAVRTAFDPPPLEEPLLPAGRLMPVAAEEDIGPGDVLAETLSRAGTVRALYVALTDRTNPRDLYALHHCVLRIFFDGEENPSVEAPLCDFFGSGFDLTPFESLVVGTDKRLSLPLPDRRASDAAFMYCYFPMPYQDGLRIEIENRGESKKKIGLLLFMRVDTQPPAADALRFHARFRKDDPCQVLDNPVLDVTGRGRIVGCVLNVDCPRAVWWGEGDDKVWIDGERFPSYFGTGSEDYLGDAWGLHLHIRPLQGVTRTARYGKNSAYRWHIADCIDFQRSAKFTIENWQFYGFKDTYYSTVGYWYADVHASDQFARLTDEDLTVQGLRIPGSVEIEGHIATADWGNEIKEKYAGGAEFSGGLAAAVTTAEPVEITIPSKEAQTVKLALRVNPRRSFETITVTDAGGRTVGTVPYDRSTEGLYAVGVLRLKAGDNVVRVQCSKPAMLDCWVLTPTPHNGRGPEGEDLAVVSSEGVQVKPEYGRLEWSDGGQLAASFHATGDTLVLALPEQKDDRVVALRLDVTSEPTGGRFQTLLDGQPIGEPFETRADKAAIQRVYLGSTPLARGAHTLGFRALGENAETGGGTLGLDVVELAPSLGPDVVECEELTIAGEHGANSTRQGIAGASGDEQIWCRPTEPGAWIEFAVPVAKGGRYRVTVAYVRSWDYGIVQASVNGTAAGEPVDLYAPQITPGVMQPLGVFDLPAGTLHLKVEVTGHSAGSKGYFFGVDGVGVEPVR